MTTLEATTPTVPMIVSLPPGGSSCATCGLVVARPDPRTIHTMMSMGRIPAPGQPHVQAMDQAVQVEFARCPQCQALHDRAAVLLDEHPRVERRLGSRRHAIQKVEAALVAIDVLHSSADWLVSDAAADASRSNTCQRPAPSRCGRGGSRRSSCRPPRSTPRPRLDTPTPRRKSEPWPARAWPRCSALASIDPSLCPARRMTTGRRAGADGAACPP